MSKQINSLMLDGELGDYIRSHSYFFRERLVMYPDQACAMPADFLDLEEEILNLDVLPDDTWVVSYPKCGTTWTQEMVWLIANGLDYEGAKKDLTLRFPFMEYHGLNKETNALLGLTADKRLDDVKNQKPPRFIKSHLPVGLLPRKLWEVKPKIIYVMREPKDVAVSYYNHYIAFTGYTGAKEKFFDGFTSDQLLWGSYMRHVALFWRMRHQPNILINTFEDMKNDLSAVIRRTAKFLGKVVPDVEMDKLLEHLHFSNMKDNEFANMAKIVDFFKTVHGVNNDNKFMNEGNVGNYKEKMSPEWIQRFDEWKKQEKIKYGLDTDREFPY